MKRRILAAMPKVLAYQLVIVAGVAAFLGYYLEVLGRPAVGAGFVFFTLVSVGMFRGTLRAAQLEPWGTVAWRIGSTRPIVAGEIYVKDPRALLVRRFRAVEDTQGHPLEAVVKKVKGDPAPAGLVVFLCVMVVLVAFAAGVEARLGSGVAFVAAAMAVGGAVIAVRSSRLLREI